MIGEVVPLKIIILINCCCCLGIDMGFFDRDAIEMGPVYRHCRILEQNAANIFFTAKHNSESKTYF
jgi:hypothetical protein